MCWPQPAQVTLLQMLQVAGAHMVFLLFLSLLRAHEAGEESWFLRVVLVTLALLRLWDASHDLIYVLSTSGPTGFAALAAGDFLTHFLVSFRCIFAGSPS